MSGISHFYFETKDFEKSQAFWQTLGFEPIMDLSRPEEKAGLFKKDDLTLMMKETKGAPIQQTYFAMKDGAAVDQALRAQTAVKVIKPLFKSHWNTELIEIEDPDGRRFFLEAGHD